MDPSALGVYGGLLGIFAAAESSGGSNLGTDTTKVDQVYQQFPDFAKQYGIGETGVLNFAHQALAKNPGMPIGDLYAYYVLGHPATFAQLAASNAPGAKGAAANFAHQSGVSPTAPAASLMGYGADAAAAAYGQSEAAQQAYAQQQAATLAAQAAAANQGLRGGTSPAGPPSVGHGGH